jgi:phage terminase small subunit
MANRRVSQSKKQLRGTARKVKKTPSRGRVIADRKTPAAAPAADGSGAIGALSVRFYNEVKPLLVQQGTYRPADESALRILCRALAINEFAFERISREPTHTDSSGATRKSVFFQIWRDSGATVSNFARLLGIGALSREALSVVPDDDPYAELSLSEILDLPDDEFERAKRAEGII